MSARSKYPPARAMRENPDIEQLKRQAKELPEAYRAEQAEAVLEVTAHLPAAAPDTFALHDAQFVLARSYGFESWPKLKAAVDGVTTARLFDAVRKSDLRGAREILARRPELVDSGSLDAVRQLLDAGTVGATIAGRNEPAVARQSASVQPAAGPRLTRDIRLVLAGPP